MKKMTIYFVLELTYNGQFGTLNLLITTLSFVLLNSELVTENNC